MHYLLYISLFLGICVAVYYDNYPGSVSMPITVYDFETRYQVQHRINGTNAKGGFTDSNYGAQYLAAMKSDSSDLEHCLCDFNICDQSSREKNGGSIGWVFNGLCPHHKHGNPSIEQSTLPNSQVKLTLGKDPETGEVFPEMKDSSELNQSSYLATHLWYRDSNPYNYKVNSTIILTKKTITSSGPLYIFNKTSNFFPIDNKGWDNVNYNDTKTGNGGIIKKSHNYVFATHFHAAINYTSTNNQVTISSDDDSWLFINNQLAINYGGTRPPTSNTFTISNSDFKEGQVYPIDFFHADRCETQSSFSIFGPIVCDLVMGDKDNDGDGALNCQDECPDNELIVSLERIKDKTNKKTKKKCGCEGNFENGCVDCTNLPSESVCNKYAESQNCEWCKVGGKCTTKGSCDCEDISEEQCASDDYKNSAKKCTWCATGNTKKSCNELLNCDCSVFKDEDTCMKASDERCIWCGNYCSSVSEQCHKCSTYTKKHECISVHNNVVRDNFNCAWCTNGLNEEQDESIADSSGSCREIGKQCPCSDAEDLSQSSEKVCGPTYIKGVNNNDSIPSDYNGITKITRTTKGIKKDNAPNCRVCQSEEEGGGEVCIKSTSNCEQCLFQGNEHDCTSKGCHWCGLVCREETHCPTCSDPEIEDESSCKGTMKLNNEKIPISNEFCIYCNSETDLTIKGEEINNCADSNCKTCDFFNFSTNDQLEVDSATIDIKSLFFNPYFNCSLLAVSDLEKSEYVQMHCAEQNNELVSICKTFSSSEEDCKKNSFCVFNTETNACGLRSSDSWNEIIKANTDKLTQELIKRKRGCLGNVANPCIFCGDLLFLYERNGVLEFPNFCVPSSSDQHCPECEALASSKPEDGTEVKVYTLPGASVNSPCHALIDDKSNLQKCGYCESTGKCLPLENQQEYANTYDDEREDYLFFSSKCDVDCNNYATSEQNCRRSKLECAWCQLTDGSHLCLGQEQECPACKEYSSAFLCNAAGCKWCDMSSQCVTGNKACPELPAVIGIAAGVIAAIIIAAVVGVAITSFASKKVYDAIVEARESSMESAASNPLFESKEDGGANPLFE